MSYAEGADRRRYVRQRMSSLAYVELGKDNGGIVLNVSEGGLAVAAATPMGGDALPRIRFRLPGSARWIEAVAEVAWISETKKEAGITFVDLADVDRTRIRLWICAPEPVGADASKPEPTLKPMAPPRLRVVPPLAPPTAKEEREPQANAQAEPRLIGDEAAASVFSRSDASWSNPLRSELPEPVREVAATLDGIPQPKQPIVRAMVPPMPPEIPAAASLPPANAAQPVAATPRLGESLFGASLFGGGGASGPTPAQERSGEYWVRPEEPSSHWPITIVLIAIFALVSFFAGTVAGRHSFGDLLAVFGKSQAPSDVSNSQQPPSSSAAADPTSALNSTPSVPQQLPRAAAPPVSAPNQEAANSQAADTPAAQPEPPDHAASASGAPPRSAAAADPAQQAEATPEADSGSLRPDRREPYSAPSGSVQEANRGSIRSGRADAFVPQPSPVTSAPPSVVAEPPARALAAPAPPPSAPAESAAASAAAQVVPPVAPPLPSGTVEVVTTPYPSIRVPSAISSSRTETPLRLGELATRVEPVYPLEALRQGLQGTVQLHILIGADGSVKDMEVVRGPQPLIGAVRYAVGRWHYQPTYLGSDAVETEADVTVNFRLNSAAK